MRITGDNPYETLEECLAPDKPAMVITNRY
jgi:hypothetical protein